jgi:hypothetical protein
VIEPKGRGVLDHPLPRVMTNADKKAGVAAGFSFRD